MVYKFKTFEEAQTALWHFVPDEKYYAQIRVLFALANKLYPPQFRQGIFLFKTIQAANESKEEKRYKKHLI